MKRRFKKIIQIELNELSEDLLQKNVSRGKLPYFGKIISEWQHAHTFSESRYEHLEPWIQWVTAHTGKTFAEHQVFHLGDAGKLTCDQIWETLSDHDLESGIVGCMNATRGRAKGGVFFPDPWAKNGETYPAKLQEAWNFISRRVQSHAVARGQSPSIASGLKTFFDMKVQPSLAMRISAQLIRQKLDRSKKWGLAALFDEFLFGFFDELLDNTNFAFNALFLNSMAHYQHHYWRQHEPELFNGEIKCPDCGPEDDPILFGLQSYDRMIKNIIEKYASDPSVLVLICTGLSQVPYRQDEERGGMNYYRLKDHKGFAHRAGLGPVEVFPLMSRDWQISAAEAAMLDQAYRKLVGMTINGQKLFKLEKNSESSYFIETAVVEGFSEAAEIKDLDGQLVGRFYDYFGSIAVKSGCHSSRGSLWCSQPVLLHEQVPKMCLTQVPQITLDNFGIKNESKSPSAAISAP